jgi:hypothetical protein
MHDLHVERFLKNEAGDGPIKAFTLRGIKDGGEKTGRQKSGGTTALRRVRTRSVDH